MSEHADQLFARLLHSLQIRGGLTQLVLEALGEDRAPHARCELDRFERLGDVVDPADFEALAQIFVSVPRGDEDHGDVRCLRLGLEAAAGLPAVHAGHHHVEQDQVRLLGPRKGDRALAGARDLCLAADRLEAPRQELHVRDLVVDDEHLAERDRDGPADRRRAVPRSGDLGGPAREVPQQDGP